MHFPFSARPRVHPGFAWRKRCEQHAHGGDDAGREGGGGAVFRTALHADILEPLGEALVLAHLVLPPALELLEVDLFAVVVVDLAESHLQVVLAHLLRALRAQQVLHQPSELLLIQHTVAVLVHRKELGPDLCLLLLPPLGSSTHALDLVEHILGQDQVVLVACAHLHDTLLRVRVEQPHRTAAVPMLLLQRLPHDALRGRGHGRVFVELPHALREAADALLPLHRVILARGHAPCLHVPGAFRRLVNPHLQWGPVQPLILDAQGGVGHAVQCPLPVCCMVGGIVVLVPSAVCTVGARVRRGAPCFGHGRSRAPKTHRVPFSPCAAGRAGACIRGRLDLSIEIAIDAANCNKLLLAAAAESMPASAALCVLELLLLESRKPFLRHAVCGIRTLPQVMTPRPAYP
eukprot:COSAG01_NODE_977_length_12361_cov_167.523483_4_plen_404_part_00